MRLTRLLLSLAFLGAFAAALAGLGTVLALADRYGRDLPDHMQLATYVPRLGSEVRAADGSFMSRRAVERRTFVPYDRIPPLVREAFVAAEDRNYATHMGVDPVGVVRAVLSNANRSGQSGGSTITQQVAKNLLVGNERSLSRKVREALLAYRMDRDLGKRRVLEIYLNEIYLGLGAYGVAEAADTYFGKTLDALRPEEAALIAAMPKAPSAFNPVANPSRALERRNYVLRRMAEDGYIPRADLAADQATRVALADRGQRTRVVEGQGGWMDDAAWKAAVAAPEVGPDAVAKRDLVVRSTERPRLQDAAEAALRKGIVRADRSLGWRGPAGHVALPPDWSDDALSDPPDGYEAMVALRPSGDAIVMAARDGSEVALDREATRWTGRRPAELLRPGDVALVDRSGDRPVLAQEPGVEGAMVVVDPRTGDVMAMVGGFSHDRAGVFNRATQARRQPGSSFKPVVYSAALGLGFDATTPLVDAPIAIEQGPGQEDWRPADAKSAGHGGLLTVRRALELSRNMATVRLLWNIGLDDVSATARRLGFDFDAMSYPYALGAGEVSPLRLAMAYCAFANGGLLPTARFVTSVEARDGTPLKAFPPQPPTQAVDPVVSAQVYSILRGVVERGTAAATFKGFSRPLAGKTGTTNGSRDAWFVGFAADMVAVVWIGRDDDGKLADGETGGRLAAPVVRDFLEAAGDAVRLEPVPVPAEGVTMVTSDPVTGLPSRDGIPEIVRTATFEAEGSPANGTALAAAAPRGGRRRDRQADRQGDRQPARQRTARRAPAVPDAADPAPVGDAPAGAPMDEPADGRGGDSGEP